MTEPIPNWPGKQETELVAGVERPLGRMSLDELLELESDARERIEEARTDLSVVRDYKDHMFPGAIAEVVSIDLLRAQRDGVVRELKPAVHPGAGDD